MKAILEFNLDEEEDRLAHERCVRSLDMALALWEIDAKVNRMWDECEDGKHIDADFFIESFKEILAVRNILLDNLVR